MGEYGYIGVKPCGCAVAAIVDDEEYKNEIAAALPKWIKNGLTIERVTIEEGRKRLARCQHKQEDSKCTDLK